MKGKYLKYSFFRYGLPVNILLIFLGTIGNLQSQTVAVTISGSWNYSVNMSDIVDAGSDFTGTYSSSANQVFIDVSLENDNSNRNFRWQIDIRREDLDWDNTLQLFAQRTGNGTGQGNSISGGTAFQQITQIDQYFFRGNKKRFDIPIQYEVRNVSVTIPAKTYSTNIVYTVTSL
jgi:hypothetical protein